MEQLPVSFMNFAKSVFVLGGRYHLRNQAREDLNEHVCFMKSKASQKKRILPSDIDKIHEKFHNVIEKEKRLCSFNSIDREKLEELTGKVSFLERELANEKNENSDYWQR